MPLYLKCVYNLPELGDVGILSAQWADSDAPEQGWHMYAVPVSGDCILWEHRYCWDIAPCWQPLSSIPDAIINGMKAIWEEYQTAQQNEGETHE
jgi:hypothetical protein